MVEVFRHGQGGMTVRTPQKGDIIIRRTPRVPSRRGGGGRSSGGGSRPVPEPNVIIKPLKSGAEIVIDGMGYSVGAGNIESFLKSKNLSGSRYSNALAVAKVQDEIFKQQEIKRMEAAKQAEAEKRRIEQLKRDLERKGAQTKERISRNKLGQRIKITETILKRIEQGKGIGGRVVVYQNLDTGKTTYREFKGYKGNILSGGVDFKKQGSLESIRIQENLRKSNLKPMVQEGQVVGFTSSYTKRSYPYTNSGISAFNNDLKKLTDLYGGDLNKIKLNKIESIAVAGDKKISSVKSSIKNFVSDRLSNRGINIKDTKVSKFISNVKNDLKKTGIETINKYNDYTKVLNNQALIRMNNSKVNLKKPLSAYQGKDSYKEAIKFFNSFKTYVGSKSILFAIDTGIAIPVLINSLKNNPLSTIVTLPPEIIKGFRDDFRTVKSGDPKSILDLAIEYTTLAAAFKIGGKTVKATTKNIQKLFPEARKIYSKTRRLSFVKNGGKIPKLRIKTIEESLKPIATIKNIERLTNDLLKNIPKTITETKSKSLIESSKNIIESFLKNEKVLKELKRKFPDKIKFSIKDIKKIRLYPKLINTLKKEVFVPKGIKIPSKIIKRVEKKQRIGGVEVFKKEFKSYNKGIKELEKWKNLNKFVQRIEQKGGIGIVEKISRKLIISDELQYLKRLRQLPKQFLQNVKKIDGITFTQKFSARVPILKRFGGLKDGIWKVIIQDKIFYQNSVSFSFYNKIGKPMGTITFNTLSSKPINKFRSIINAIKWGRNKEVVLSRLSGENFVTSYRLKSRGKKISSEEFLSKIQIKSNGILKDFTIDTKKIPSFKVKGKIEEQFKKSIPVSKTKGRAQKSKIPSKIKWNKNKKFLEIIQKGKTIDKIYTKSIINPVIIDTSKALNIINQLDLLKKIAFQKSRLKTIKKAKKLIKDIKSSKPLYFNNKKNIVISKEKLKQVEKLLKEERLSKESLAGRTIPTKLKITKRLEGINDLKKLKQAERLLKKTRNDLLKRNALDIGSKIAISQSLLLLRELEKKLKEGKVLQSDQKIDKLQKQITETIQKSGSKLKLKTANFSLLKFPILLPLNVPIGIIKGIPRNIPKRKIRIPKKRKKIIIKQEELKNGKKFKNLSKPSRIYNVLVKKRGKEVLLKDRLIKKDALNLMSYELDNQLLKTAKLKPLGVSKRARIISQKYNDYFENKKKKFRSFKIRKNKKFPILGYIEKRKYHLDTPLEKAQMRILRRKASKRKITPSQKKILIERLKKAREVRMRNLKKKR
jgi:hypothetical protein